MHTIPTLHQNPRDEAHSAENALEESTPPSSEMVPREHILWLFRGILEPLIHESQLLHEQMRVLVNDIYKARHFIDTDFSISNAVGTPIDYKEHKFLFLISSTAATLALSSGGTITVPVNVWVGLSFKRGTIITALGVPDATPIVVTIRACDTPIETAQSILGTIPVQGNVGSLSNYPAGAIPITASSGNVANAVATATLAAVAAKITYIAGFEITGSGATAGLPVIVTVTNTVTGTLSYIYTATVGVLLPDTPLIIEFSEAIPANAPNVAIVVSCPALGLGNTNNAVVAHGYQL